MLAIRSIMATCVIAKDWDVTAKLQITTMMARKSLAVMGIDATDGEGKLGSAGAVGAGDE